MNRASSMYVQTKNFIWLEIYMVSLYGFFRDFLGVPDKITYLFDFITFGVFLVAIASNRAFRVKEKLYKGAVWIIIVFLLSTFIGLFISGGYSLLLYLWGFRNIFRFYVLFLNCVIYFDWSDVKKFTSFVIKIFYLNVATAIFEWLMGNIGDSIGGTYGIEVGGNGFLNIFLIMAICVAIIEFLNKKRSFRSLICIAAMSFFVAAIAELKAFIIEFLIIILAAMFLGKFSFKKVLIAVVSVIIAIGGIYAMDYLTGNSAIDFFSENEEVIEYAAGEQGYTSSGDLNRANAISQITEMFFKGNVKRQLFGFGLGNCSYSAYDFLTSDFYKKYSNLHYVWLTDAMVYIETGAVGIVLYWLFFIMILIMARKMSKKFMPQSYEKIATESVAVLALLCIFLSIYNASLHVESGYIVYAMLSLPVVINKSNKIK